MPQGKEKVAYFYDSEVGGAYYGASHPMKPHRICMAHHLILGYGLHKHMEVYKPRKATYSELLTFHDAYYIHYLSMVNKDNQDDKDHGWCYKHKEFNFGSDCPVFDGLFDFCQIYAGASLEGARKLNSQTCDIAINWSGGLHHAKKAAASGFCYVNDLVLAILELLKYHARVLYVDIDVHHGDGVEEAFYLSDRVMTVSFHQYGAGFFPSTGSVDDFGEQRGKFYSLNVPLRRGYTDATFHSLYKPIMSKVVEVFNPSVIVYQSGADSIANDRIGLANLTIEGHGEALAFMKRFKIPMLVTGGGGYTKSNVARCWAYETSLLVDEEIPDQLPRTIYDGYFSTQKPANNPPMRLNKHITSTMWDNTNQQGELDLIKERIMEYLRHLEHTPAVQMHYAPSSKFLPSWPCEEDEEKLKERIVSYSRRHCCMGNEVEDVLQESARENETVADYRWFGRNDFCDEAFVY